MVENVASRKTAIFDINIWALHHMDSLIPIPKIRIFTNYFTNMNIFCEKERTGIVFKRWKFLVKIQNSGFRNSWSHVVSQDFNYCHKIMIILFEKNGAKKTIRTINCARDRMVVLVRNQFYSNDCKDWVHKKDDTTWKPFEIFPSILFCN